MENKVLQNLTEIANNISNNKQLITESLQSHNDVIAAAKLAQKFDRMYKGKKLSIKKGAKGVWINNAMGEGYDYWKDIKSDMISEPVVSVEIRNTRGSAWMGPGTVKYEAVVFTEDGDVGFKIEKDKDIQTV